MIMDWTSVMNQLSSTIPVCPSGFKRSTSRVSGCAAECPANKGFEMRNLNDEPFCVYKDRPEFKLLLKIAPAIPSSPGQDVPTLDSLQAMGGSVYQEYKDAKDDYDKNMPVLLAQISRETQITDAFRQLQTAENARDQSPQAYQDARNRYYTLVNGDSWLQQESQRIAGAEVTPKVNQYNQIKSDLTTRLNQQQQTIDVVNAVKDKVLSMKDDFAYTTNTFSKQISELKNQIQMERKKTEIQKVEVFSWVDALLNIALSILVLGLVVVIIRKMLKQRQTQSPAYTSSYRY